MAGYAHRTRRKGRSAPPVPTLRTLTISADEFEYEAELGSTLAMISSYTPGSTITVDNTAFAISGYTLTRGATAWGAETTFNIVLTETLTGANGSPKNTTIEVTIGVDPTVVTLAALALDDVSYAHAFEQGGVLANISGRTANSTLSVADTRFGIDSADAELLRGAASWTASSTFDVDIVETLIGAVGSPRTSTISVSVEAAAPVGDVNLTIRATDDQFAQDDIAAYLAQIADGNYVSVTVSGPVAMQIRGFYDLHSTGTKSRPKARLKRFLRAITTGATVGDTCTWSFSGKDGAGETGNTVTMDVVWTIATLPRMTITMGTRNRVGQGGFPLSRLPGTASHWALTDQSTSGRYQIWDNEAVSYAGATYMGTRTPLAESSDWVDLTNATLGRTDRLTINTSDDLIDIRPSPTKDNMSVAPRHQLGYILTSGDCTGHLYYGETIVSREGTYNPASVDLNIFMRLPEVGSTAMPLCPFGTNADVNNVDVGWNYETGWNPGWITIAGDTPRGTEIGLIPVKMSGILPQSDLQADLWIRNYNLRGAVIRPFADYVGYDIPDKPQYTAKDFRGWAADHCENFIVVGCNDYGTQHFATYNFFDQSVKSTSGFGGIRSRDSQCIGNLLINGLADFFNGIVYNTTLGSGRSKFNWNISTHKQLNMTVHSDFVQPNGLTLKATPLYYAITAGQPIDLGEHIGNMCLKGRGYRMQTDDIYGHQFYMHDKKGTGFPAAPMEVGEEVWGATSGSKVVITRRVDNRQYFAYAISPFTLFQVGEVVTGQTSGVSGVINYDIRHGAVTGGPFQVGETVRNAGNTKTAEITYVATTAPLLIYGKALTGGKLNAGEVLTQTTGTNAGATATITSSSSVATTSWNNGMPVAGDEGKTPGDSQGWFSNDSGTTNQWRRDIHHWCKYAGNVMEGLSGFGFQGLAPGTPAVAPNQKSWFVHNFSTFPFATVSEVGTPGAYYEKGIWSTWEGPSQANYIGTKYAGMMFVKNVFTVCPGTENAVVTVDNLGEAFFGFPSRSGAAPAPAQIAASFEDPFCTATVNGVDELMVAWSPKAGAIQTTHNSQVFGAFGTGIIDHDAQTFDDAAVFSYTP